MRFLFRHPRILSFFRLRLPGSEHLSRFSGTFWSVSLDIRQVQLELWSAMYWIHIHNNTPCKWGLLTLAFLVKNNIVLPAHKHYSLDLVSTDLPHFPKMKNQFKGDRFRTVIEMQIISQKFIVSPTEREFQSRLQKGAEMVRPVW